MDADPQWQPAAVKRRTRVLKSDDVLRKLPDGDRLAFGIAVQAPTTM
jgi:hypothetical protein